MVVAYNAEGSITKLLDRIPDLPEFDTEVLILDDASADSTFEAASSYHAGGRSITVLTNWRNQGYGGNQKIGYHYALKHGFDVVAMLHGDGQYAPECLPELLKPFLEKRADAVFGSRMMRRGGALQGGMPFYKFVGNKILTALQNRLLGLDLSEFHSGYRLYSREALSRIPFELNANDFSFDTEIIIQLARSKARIVELPIPTHYGDEVCHVNGMKYAWQVAKASWQAKLQQMGLFYDPRFDLGETRQYATTNPSSTTPVRTSSPWTARRPVRVCWTWAAVLGTWPEPCAKRGATWSASTSPWTPTVAMRQSSMIWMTACPTWAAAPSTWSFCST